MELLKIVSSHNFKPCKPLKKKKQIHHEIAKILIVTAVEI